MRAGWIEAAKKKSKQIDTLIRQEMKRLQNQVRFLLLGIEGCGKSTFIKQMIDLHRDSISREEITKFKDTLRQNCLIFMKRILQSENVMVPISLQKSKEIVLSVASNADGFVKVHREIVSLWKDHLIKAAFYDRIHLQLQIPDTSDYVFDHCERFAQEYYVPTSEDIMKTKFQNSAVFEIRVEISGVEFIFIDICQSTGSRKWLPCLEDVSAIIYFASLSAFDMLLEDGISTRLEASLKLFGELSSSPHFKSQCQPWILFLTKSDEFQDKLKSTSLSQFYPDFSAEGGNEFTAASQFIQSLFIEKFHKERFKLYPYVTCDIDTANGARIFASIKDKVIYHALMRAGF